MCSVSVWCLICLLRHYPKGGPVFIGALSIIIIIIIIIIIFIASLH